VTIAMNTQDESSDIAVVGIACRLPGATSVGAYWQVLVEGRDTATVFTDDALLAAGVDGALLRDPRYVKVSYPLADVELFDAEYFNVPADEAELMDPQHRHFLECAVEALEDAGHDPSRRDNRVGVYAGVSMNTYLLSNLMGRYRSASLLGGHYRMFVANDKDFLATRVSHKLDLRGPSLAVNTACSSSLVAVHLACTGLLSGECDMALAGAAHIRVPQVAGYLYQEAMILSADGHCRPFDRAAGGTNVGSGVGIVVLKRLCDALADRDAIYAVIKGSAINNDGALKVGYTAPSVRGQTAVVAEAQRVAGCAADTISYVEAHGTGTPIGDPAEIAALTDVFSRPRAAGGRVAIGSVKGNIGHLDTASGVAGLIKACLMLRHGRLVPSLYFEAAPAGVALESSPFFVNTELRDWQTGATPRRAGVSSFGIGGTNAHVILEEAPKAPAQRSSDASQLLVVSARTKNALGKATGNLARLLNRNPKLELRDVAFTLAQGRREHPYRCALVCRDTRDAAMALALADPQRSITGHAPDPARTRVLVPADGNEAELRRVGQLWAAGATLDWPVNTGAHRVSLATYPFERQRFWIEPDARGREATEKRAGLRERLAQTPETERVTVTVDRLRGMVAEIVGPAHPRPDPDASLFDLGLDSLILIEVAAKLSDELGSEVRASAFIEHPNIRAFAVHLLTTLHPYDPRA
jgi:acyl transferase domain-containing protein